MPTPRYEREIRALLDRMSDFLPEAPGAPRSAPRPLPLRPPATNGRRDWLRLDAYVLAAVLVVLARLGSPVLGVEGTHIVAYAAVLLFVLGFAASLLRAFAPPIPPKIWRGRPF